MMKMPSLLLAALFLMRWEHVFTFGDEMQTCTQFNVGYVAHYPGECDNCQYGCLCGNGVWWDWPDKDCDSLPTGVADMCPGYDPTASEYVDSGQLDSGAEGKCATFCNTIKDKDIKYLDRHWIVCPLNYALTNWHMFNPGHYDPGHHIPGSAENNHWALGEFHCKFGTLTNWAGVDTAYAGTDESRNIQYHCEKLPGSVPYQIEERQTSWNANGDLSHLDRHDVHCDQDSPSEHTNILSSWHLETNPAMATRSASSSGAPSGLSPWKRRKKR